MLAIYLNRLVFKYSLATKPWPLKYFIRCASISFLFFPSFLGGYYVAYPLPISIVFLSYVMQTITTLNFSHLDDLFYRVFILLIIYSSILFIIASGIKAVNNVVRKFV